MSVNSTARAKPVTEADHRTLSHVKMLADSLFGDEFKASVLLYQDSTDSNLNGYLSTVVTSSITDHSPVLELGLHGGSTREEALLGLLRTLERLMATKSLNMETPAVEFWEKIFELTEAKEAAERAARDAMSKESNDGVDGPRGGALRDIEEDRNQAGAQVKGKRAGPPPPKRRRSGA